MSANPSHPTPAPHDAHPGLRVVTVDSPTGWHAAVLIEAGVIECIGFRSVRGRDEWLNRLRRMVRAVWQTL